MLLLLFNRFAALLRFKLTSVLSRAGHSGSLYLLVPICLDWRLAFIATTIAITFNVLFHNFVFVFRALVERPLHLLFFLGLFIEKGVKYRLGWLLIA